MIELNININPDDIPPKKAKYDQEVTASLQEIANLLPRHKDTDFEKRLWGYFKQELWQQQGFKCAYCESSLVADASHLEHFRPKSEVRSEDNDTITREAYWWLVYDHRNYLVSCSICNNQKGNQFPIEDEKNRVTASNINEFVDLNDEGVLEKELPHIINPRYKNPEPHIVYSYTPDQVTPMVHIAPKDETGCKTIKILDLNRIRKNKKETKDPLPRKRGSILNNFKKEIEGFNLLKIKLHSFRVSLAALPNDNNLKKMVDDTESVANNKRDNIKERFLSMTAQFSGMCAFWLKNDTDLANDFIEKAA
ncbi:MAG: hypothetical protein ACUZ8E_09295 [Candidatus Anammoxibacter sp.]